MIPAWIDSQSTAENRVFKQLASDSATRDWTVLHSLSLSRTEKWPYGEIDFVVIVPREGIVCLEVKGGGVSCEDGIYRGTDRYGNSYELRRSPWEQARVSMQALRKSVNQYFGETALESLCPFGCAVVFPDVTCPPPTPEFERWEAIDCEDLKQPISQSIMRVARRRLREFQPRTGERLPTASEVKTIRKFLRPDFDRFPAIGASLEKAETKLLRLTEEQYAALDTLEEEPRCLFKGAAGTGKTLLALEYARQAGRDGLKVLFVCFNLLLGKWLHQKTEDMKGVTAGPWYEFAKKTIMGSNMEDSLKKEFEELDRELWKQGKPGKDELYDEIYPLYYEQSIPEPPFDVLVVDEAQDMAKKSILYSLDLTVLGGLAGGRWAMFGDSTQKILYDGAVKPDEILPQYGTDFVRERLSMNCRNTRPIAEKTAALTGFEKSPFVLNQEEGLPVERRYWKTSSDLRRSLENRIDQLTAREKVPIQNIVVLSPYTIKKSKLFGVGKISGFPLVNISSAQSSAGAADLKFSNIRTFKGLESQVVIIVDIDKIDNVQQSLLYVGMSRARSLLILMIHEDIREAVESRIGRD